MKGKDGRANASEARRRLRQRMASLWVLPAAILRYMEIGRRLGRDSSVISREVARHGGRARYRAAAAHEAACAGRERPKLFVIASASRARPSG